MSLCDTHGSRRALFADSAPLSEYSHSDHEDLLQQMVSLRQVNSFLARRVSELERVQQQNQLLERQLKLKESQLQDITAQAQADTSMKEFLDAQVCEMEEKINQLTLREEGFHMQAQADQNIKTFLECQIEELEAAAAQQAEQHRAEAELLRQELSHDRQLIKKLRIDLAKANGALDKQGRRL